MITKQDPTQPKLWSRFQDLLSDVALEELDRGWQGVFHRMILQQLPVEIMEEKFNKYTGRPSKELYSVCGLLLIMNYFGWTLSQARLNYMVDLGVQYALNIEKDAVELSERTLHRYLDWLRKKDFMQDAMSLVTECLVKEMDLDIREQRVDSTSGIEGALRAEQRVDLWRNLADETSEAGESIHLRRTARI